MKKVLIGLIGLFLTLSSFSMPAVGDNCSSPDVILSLPHNDIGMTTCGALDDYSSLDACGSAYMNGEDYVYEYTPAVDVCVNVTLTNTSTWVGVFITDGCPAGGVCVAFDTQAGGNPSLSGVNLIGGTTYYITISTWPLPDCTPFDILIEECPPPPPPCYTVTPIAYTPDPYGVGTLVPLTDDIHSAVIPIGFSFCFYGNVYTDIVVSSNNYVSFNLANAGAWSPWVTTTIPTAVPAQVMNSIMGPWHDINPGVGGTVRYQVYGVAPNRRLVVSYQNVPMFSCTGLLYTSQITLYETTNCIENYIENKPVCLTWNNGFATQGLNDATGTAATVNAGRNNTVWAATNEAIRYEPICAPCQNTGCSVVLPVEFLYFNGHKEDDKNVLNWATASESNNSHFIIERSSDGEVFESIGEVSGSGNSSHKITYTYDDYTPNAGINYYRLKQVDFNGEFDYSSIIAINNTDFKPVVVKAYNYLMQEVEYNEHTSKGLFILEIEVEEGKFIHKKVYIK